MCRIKKGQVADLGRCPSDATLVLDRPGFA
jgi:hypothetical protein